MPETKRYRTCAAWGEVEVELYRDQHQDGLLVVHPVGEPTMLAEMHFTLLDEIPPPIPDEPEPGAYLIGETNVFRFPGRMVRWFWALNNAAGGCGWEDWPELWKRFGGPDVPIRRLVPEPEPGRVQLRKESNFHVGGGDGEEWYACHLIVDGEYAGTSFNMQPDRFAMAAALLTAAGGGE